MDEFWKTCRKKTETPEGEVKMGRVFKEFEELCLARGMAAGFAEGFAEGFVQGFAEGLAEARAERSKQIEQIVTNMLRRGYSSAEISLCTGVGTDKVAFIARNAGISI